jgi:hypothetical protein
VSKMENLKTENKLVIINFGSAISDKLKLEIEAQLQVPIEIRQYNPGINMKKNIYVQCVDLVDKINIDELPMNFVLNLPGLPISACYIVNEIEARTGTKPQILELHREKDSQGVLSDFRFGKIRSLEFETQYTRKKIENQNKGDGEEQQ